MGHGIRLLSESKKSKGGEDLASFMNLDLPWKKAVKGCRSARRRPRKQIAGRVLKDKVGAAKKCFDSEAISESKRLTVQHLSQKIESVPLKKRRKMIWSPSPSPPPPHSTLSHQHGFCANSGLERTIKTGTNNVDKAESDAVDKKTSDGDENNISIHGHSGIEILADVACDDNLDLDMCHDMEVSEESERLEDESPLHVLGSSLEKATSIQRDVVGISHEYSADRCSREVEKCVSSRVDRSYWDLNLPMNSWEIPGDILQCEEIQVEAMGSDANKIVDSFQMHGKTLTSLIMMQSPLQHSRSGQVEQILQQCDVSHGRFENGLTQNDTSQLSSLVSTVGDDKVSAQVSSKETFIDSFVKLETTSIKLLDEIKSENSDQGREYGSSGMNLNKAPCLDNVHLKSDTNFEKVGIPDGKTFLQEKIGPGLKVEPVTESKGVFYQASVKCEDTSTSGVDDSSNSMPMDKSSVNIVASQGVGGSSSSETGELHEDGSTSSKLNIRDPSSNHFMDASRDDKDSSIQGYDSQFEDGELRESYEVEEIDQVDYEPEPEFEEEITYGIEETNVKKLGEVEKGACLASDDITGKSRCSSRDALMGSTKIKDGKNIEKLIVLTDGFDITGSNSEGIGPNASKLELPSHAERLSSPNMIQRGRSNTYSNSYPPREMDAGKFMGRGRPAWHFNRNNPGARHFTNSPTCYSDSKRRHSSIYNGKVFPRTKTDVESHMQGTNNNFQRQYFNSNPNRQCRSFHRSSPGDRVDTYDLCDRKQRTDRSRYISYEVENCGYVAGTDHQDSGTEGVGRPGNCMRRQPSNRVGQRLGMRRSPAMADGDSLAADISPERSRLRRYPDDYTDYSGHMPHHLSWRERSNSPTNGGRPRNSQSYYKSGLTSRSRSPVAWHQHDRSSNFRPDSRIDRRKLPFQNRFSTAEHDLRSYEGKKSLPVRMFNLKQRFDSVQSIRRDDPSMRRWRSPDREVDCMYNDMEGGNKLENQDAKPLGRDEFCSR